MSPVLRKPAFCLVKTKVQISCAVTIFVFTLLIAHSLYFLSPKFQAGDHLLWLYILVCVKPDWNPEDRFSNDVADEWKHICYISQCVIGFYFTIIFRFSLLKHKK